jgi:hypothetical protein
VDRLEFIALISNAPGYPGLETLSALTFGFRLEVVGAAVLAEDCTPLEETSSGEFVTGRNHIFVIRFSFDSASAPPSLDRGNYLPTQSQESYHSASSSPSARLQGCRRSSPRQSCKKLKISKIRRATLLTIPSEGLPPPPTVPAPKPLIISLRTGPLAADELARGFHC